MGQIHQRRNYKMGTNIMISIHTNTRGRTMAKSISDMNGSELVVEYNRLAAASGQKPVKRFADRKSALKRIAALKQTSSSGKKPKEDKRSKIGIEFNVRRGTNREKLLEALNANYKKQVTKRDLLKAVYGSGSEDNKAAIQMVMNGIEYMIGKGKLPYKVVKEKNDQKEITFGLYPK